MVRVIRVVAAGLGTIVLLIFFVSFLREGPPSLSPLAVGDAVGLVGAGIGLAGLVVAYSWDGIGGALAIGGFLAYAVMSRRAIGPGPMWLVPLAGLLFLALWWARRAHRTAGGIPRPGRRRLTAHPAVWIVPGLAVLVALWLAAEMALPAPILASRAPIAPPVTGRWEGATRIVDDWGPPGDVAVVLSVSHDGAAEGTIGAASFRNAQLVANRSWVGGVFHIRSDYRLSGTLSGEITRRYAIECAAFALSLSLGPQGIDGRLTASGCSRGGLKEGTMHATAVRFRKPVARAR